MSRDGTGIAPHPKLFVVIIQYYQMVRVPVKVREKQRELDTHLPVPIYL